MIDLRSDTVTKPTSAMRAAMAAAEVGDDVIDVDPTVDRLQRMTAEILGKEAAIFMPSGTMTNQVAVRIHCKPGDEFLCEAGCHIFHYEQGAFAQLSGVVARTLQGESGVLRPAQFAGQIRPDNEHLVRTRLVCLENTHNRGAGRVQPYEDVVAICRWAREHGLRTHLDGARLFNAVVASGIPAADWAQHFDTISVCFSKGLGAPVGSALVGSREFIHEARRHRKLFGGGMRQSGIIAAGALHALQYHRERLAEDHEHARSSLKRSVARQAWHSLPTPWTPIWSSSRSIGPWELPANSHRLSRHTACGRWPSVRRWCGRSPIWMSVVIEILAAAEIVPRVAEDLAGAAIQVHNDEPTY